MVLALVLLLLVVPPLIFLLNGSLHTTTVTGAPGDFTFAYYRQLLSDRQFFGSLVNSLVFSFGSMAIALAFGGLVAWLVERTNSPFKAFAYLTAIISLGTPFVLYVIAWLFLFGRNGPLNDLITAIGLPRFNVYSMPGMILVEGFSVVAARVPAAVVGVCPGQRRIRGGRAHERRRHFAHGDAHLDAAGAAGVSRRRAC